MSERLRHSITNSFFLMLLLRGVSRQTSSLCRNDTVKIQYCKHRLGYPIKTVLRRIPLISIADGRDTAPSGIRPLGVEDGVFLRCRHDRVTIIIRDQSQTSSSWGSLGWTGFHQGDMSYSIMRVFIVDTSPSVRKAAFQQGSIRANVGNYA